MGDKEKQRVDEYEESEADFCAEKNNRKESHILHPEDGVERDLGENKENRKDRDVGLAQVEMEKRLALIKAWEENEKTRADNKAHKKLCAIDAWENTKKAAAEAQLKQIEENFEKKKAEYAEKMKNQICSVHKAGEEKRAMIEADRRKDVLMVDETAAKFRATGYVPMKLFACFSC